MINKVIDYIKKILKEAAAQTFTALGFFLSWFLLTGSYNWNSGYNDTIAVKFHDVVFDAEL